MKVKKMIAYSIILFAVAALMFILGAAIYRGNTKLIHDYHQTNVKESERKAYGRALAIGVFATGATLLVSGMTALLDRVSVSLMALVLGLIASIVILGKVQKRYNGGVF